MRFCFFILAGILLGLFPDRAQAGRVSLLVKGSKLALEAGAKETAKEVAGKLLREQAERLTARYGSRVLEVVEHAEKKGVKRADTLRLIEDHGDVLARHGFSEEALTFAEKHGGSGVFFLRHPTLYEGLKKSADLSQVDHSVIAQAWRWGDENAIGGSMARLRAALTKAGMKGDVSRDFCEDLFIIKARSGKVPGIPMGAEILKGHIGDSRFGNDFYLAQNGKIRVIEFGTGIKPSPGELDWTRMRDRLAGFLESQRPDQRINLRKQGFPPDLVANPSSLRSPEFPIEKYVQREVYATEINKAEIARTGADIVYQQLR